MSCSSCACNEFPLAVIFSSSKVRETASLACRASAASSMLSRKGRPNIGDGPRELNDGKPLSTTTFLILIGVGTCFRTGLGNLATRPDWIWWTDGASRLSTDMMELFLELVLWRVFGPPGNTGDALIMPLLLKGFDEIFEEISAGTESAKAVNWSLGDRRRVGAACGDVDFRFLKPVSFCSEGILMIVKFPSLFNFWVIWWLLEKFGSAVSNFYRWKLSLVLCLGSQLPQTAYSSIACKFTEHIERQTSRSSIRHKRNRSTQ